MKRLLVLCVLAILSLGYAVPDAFSQKAGDTVLLYGDTSAGVPVHPGPGDAHYTRWANGTQAVIVGRDSATGWFEVKGASGSTGWVVPDHITVLLNPKLTRVRLGTNGIQFGIDYGNNGRQVVVESSVDLRQWTPICTNVFSYLKPPSFSEAIRSGERRFYRAVNR